MVVSSSVSIFAMADTSDLDNQTAGEYFIDHAVRSDAHAIRTFSTMKFLWCPEGWDLSQGLQLPPQCAGSSDGRVA